MVQLECTVFWPTVEAFSLKRASTDSAQASTSCGLPRSISARKETPAKRPAMSLGPRCDLSVAAYSPTSCSLARTPTSFSSSANLSGRTSAMKRTPPAGGAAMRTPMASSSGRRSSRPVVASRLTASVSSVVSWRSSRFLAGTMMRTQGSFSNSPGVSTRSSCSCVPSPSSAFTLSG